MFPGIPKTYVPTYGLGVEDHSHAVRRELAVTAVMERVSAQVPKPDEATLRAYYEAHPDRFNKPETREVRHILILADGDTAEGEHAEAFKAHLGQSVLFPKRLGSGEELAFAVMECITNPYMNAEVIRLDGGIRMPPK